MRTYSNIEQMAAQENKNLTMPTIQNDCFCEKYMNEMARHHRQGLQVKSLKAGDKIEVVKEITNLYGRFIRVRKDGIEYDIKPENIAL